MRQTTLWAIMLLAATTTLAADYNDRVLYWCHNNGHTNATKKLTEVINKTTDGKKGALSYISHSFDSWKIGAPPSKATLDALGEATVDAWIADREKDEKANIDAWAEKLKALAKLTFKEINKLRVKNGDAEYTWDQFKTAMKNELD